ncbi:hypothetical protein DH2020_021016 [Rehmannia glutinosa]|uniref:Mitochondrial fission protein ELM1 n=1 Tax=Rehmannia glutinosa TaxID=99300 RepID=A0ABR0WC57_REHGL
MKPIRLPEPPGSPQSMGGLPDIFEGGVYGVIRRAVIIGNGFPASENQSIGLVRALGLSEKQTLYAICWVLLFIKEKGKYVLAVVSSINVGLASVLEADVKNIVKMAKETFEKDGPLLVVASGRDTISIASSIKRLASDNVFVVQIQHPRSHLDRFDLVITPQHDYYPLSPHAQEQVPRFLRKWITPHEPPNERVVCPHSRSTSSSRFCCTSSEATAWHDEFAPLPKPLLVVNIGGPTRYCRYSTDLAKQLTASLHNVLTSCGSVRISFSRRTPEKISNMILKELGTHPKIYIWDGEVTADSVSMLSEACSTGKPVYVIGAERCTWKFVDFHKKLRERGLVRPFTGLEDMSESWSYPPLSDTSEAASRVHKALAERGWRLRP